MLEQGSPQIVEYDGLRALVFIPSWLKSGDDVRLLMWEHGSFDGDDIAIRILQSPGVDFPFEFLDGENLIIMTPVIPRNVGPDPQILERGVVFGERELTEGERFDETLYKLIDSIRKIISDAGFEVAEKIIGAGVSAGANLINRFSTLYPNLFSDVGLFCAGSYMYPAGSIKGANLSYPVGGKDLGSLGLSLNIDAIKTIRFYVYVGGEDRNPGPIGFELAGNPDLLKAYSDFAGETPVSRTKHFVEYMQSLGCDVTLEITPGVEHVVDIDVLKRFMQRVSS